MPTRTLSLDEEAYERLRRAKKDPRESFSKVIKRARWDDETPRCGDLLRRFSGLPLMGERALKALEHAQAADAPPPSKWCP